MLGLDFFLKYCYFSPFRWITQLFVSLSQIKTLDSNVLVFWPGLHNFSKTHLTFKSDYTFFFSKIWSFESDRKSFSKHVGLTFTSVFFCDFRSVLLPRLSSATSTRWSSGRTHTKTRGRDLGNNVPGTESGSRSGSWTPAKPSRPSSSPCTESGYSSRGSAANDAEWKRKGEEVQKQKKCNTLGGKTKMQKLFLATF